MPWTTAEYLVKYSEYVLSHRYNTSDYDLSKFNTNMFGLNTMFSNPDWKLEIKALNTPETRYGNDRRNTGFNSSIASLVLYSKAKVYDSQNIQHTAQTY